MKNLKELSYDEFIDAYNEDDTPFHLLMQSMDIYQSKEKTLKKYSTYVRVSFEVSVDVYAEDEYEAQDLANKNIMIEDYSNGSCGVESDWVQMDADNSTSAVEVDNMSVSSWIDDDSDYTPSLEEGEEVTLYSWEGADEDDADLWFQDPQDAFVCFTEYEAENYLDELYDKIHQND